MPIFGKKNDRQKRAVPERTVIFKLSDGTWKVPYLIDNKTDRQLIETTREMYQGRYVGAYDFYKFKLDDGGVIEITSKFSYEEIRKMWTEHGPKMGSVWGFNFKEDDEEGNKHLMIMSLLSKFGNNKTLGTGDAELDTNLAHDFILASLARLNADAKKGSKEKNKSLSAIKRQIEHYGLPEKEAERFMKILNSSEK